MNQYLSGLPAWLVQRLSALYMVIYTLLALVWYLAAPTAGYASWRALFTQPVIAILTAMFFLALLLHAWVGVRDVVLDYAGGHPALRLVLLTVLGAWLIAMAFWVVLVMATGLMV